MRCQIDIHLVHQFLILYYLLSGVLRTLWVSQISRQATDHVGKTTSFGAITVGPTILIFPRDNVISHVRGTYFKKFKFLNNSFRKQAVERIREENEMPSIEMMHDSTYTSSL